MNTELPNLPWKKVATDLFYWKASTCLLIVDIEQHVVPCVIYSCYNLVTSNITTLTNNNNVPISECLCELVY